MKRFILLAASGFIGFGLYRAAQADNRATELTKACDLAFLEDISHGNQKRLRAFAFSDAATTEERTVTAMAIAITLIRATAYDYAKVFLMPDEAPSDRAELPVSSAIIEYAPYPAAIPFMDENWTARAKGDPWSDTFAFADMTDMVEFAKEIEDSAGPRASCKVAATWTDR